MISKDTKITIIGLGLLGGSYAQGLSEAGCQVTGIDIDPEAIQYAKEQGWITEGGPDPELVAGSGIVISALYPKTFIEWVGKYQHLFTSGTILTDVTGVKRNVIREINAILRPDVEYIAAHPMAGRESQGIHFADCTRFHQANYIIVPTAANTERAIQTARDIAEALKFRYIGILTPEEHDNMIGFVSQLSHVIAVSLMNVTDCTDLVKYTGDSFRDLTRIASINENLWPELFLQNQDYLLAEIDAFVKEMQDFRNLLEAEDVEGMKQKMITSTIRRKAFDVKP
ncbi:MAG: prephenate dehydrogenase [Solobacterium sp.]|nr:prephenate dehydrogenase [Solobacterium sp.]